MKVQLRRRDRQVSDAEFLDFIEQLGYHISSKLETFLINFSGCEPDVNYFDIPNGCNRSRIRHFLSLHDIVRAKCLLGNRLMPMTIPIGDDECGNFVCVTLGAQTERVFFWDHELEDEAYNLPSMKNMFYLAEDIDAFVKLLVIPTPEELVAIEEETVEGSVDWVNPKLLEKYGRKDK